MQMICNAMPCNPMINLAHMEHSATYNYHMMIGPQTCCLHCTRGYFKQYVWKYQCQKTLP